MGKNNGNSAGNLAHGTNDHRLSDLLAVAGTFGEAAGTGDASIIALAWATFDAAIEGAVSGEKPKAGEDDAAQIYGAFAAGKRLTSVDVENPDSFKVQVSKLRSVIKVGCLPNVRKAAVQFRADFEAAWADCGKPGIYGALLKVANAQVKAGGDVSTAVIGQSDMAAAISKKPDPKTAMSKLEAARKAIDTLNTKGTETEPAFDSAHLRAALAEIDNAMKEIIAAEKAVEAEQQQQAALAGMSKSQLEVYLATLDTDVEAAA